MSYMVIEPTICDQDLNVSAHFESSMERVRYVAYEIIAPSLIALGILGNILNLVALCRPFLNECTRTYLRALAIADLHVLVFEIPMVVRLNNLQSGYHPIAVYHAHLELVLVTIFLALSIYTVLCLTMDRFVSVCFPMMFSTVHTKRKAQASIVACFVVAVVVSTPLFMLKTVCSTDSECHAWDAQENTLVTHSVFWKVYIAVSEVLIRIGPAIILAVLNVLIVRKFRTISKKRKHFHLPKLHDKAPTREQKITIRSKKYQEEKRLIVMLQAVVILFFLTMIPPACLSFMYSDSSENSLNYQVFRAVANILEIANSALNFCAYFLCSKEFRQSLLSVLGCGGKPGVQKTNQDEIGKKVSMQMISNDSMNV